MISIKKKHKQKNQEIERYSTYLLTFNSLNLFRILRLWVCRENDQQKHI